MKIVTYLIISGEFYPYFQVIEHTYITMTDMQETTDTGSKANANS